MYAVLEKVSRGFGGDNAVYKEPGGKKFIVAISWALLHPFETIVSIHDGDKLVQRQTYNDHQYIQPHVAMARMGYDVTGTFDNCTGIADFKEKYGPEDLKDFVVEDLTEPRESARIGS